MKIKRVTRNGKVFAEVSAGNSSFLLAGPESPGDDVQFRLTLVDPRKGDEVRLVSEGGSFRVEHAVLLWTKRKPK